MVMAFDLSVRLGLCPAEDAERVRRHFTNTGLPTDPTHQARALNSHVLLAHMGQDKKVSDGRITFVLVRGIGQAFLTQDVPQADVLAILQAALSD